MWNILLTNQTIDYSQYDLLHFFNIIRPADILRHTSRTKVPYVISTIFVEYGHEDTGRGLRGMLHKTFGSDGVEFIKAVARRVKIPDSACGGCDYLRLSVAEAG